MIWVLILDRTEHSTTAIQGDLSLIWDVYFAFEIKFVHSIITQFLPAAPLRLHIITTAKTKQLGGSASVGSQFSVSRQKLDCIWPFIQLRGDSEAVVISQEGASHTSKTLPPLSGNLVTTRIHTQTQAWLWEQICKSPTKFSRNTWTSGYFLSLISGSLTIFCWKPIHWIKVQQTHLTKIKIKIIMWVNISLR